MTNKKNKVIPTEGNFGTLNITPSSPTQQIICSGWKGSFESYHSNEFIFVTDGECVLTINGYSYIVTANHLALVPKHASFSHRLTSKKKLSYYFVAIDAELNGQSMYDYLELTSDNHVVAVPDGKKLQAIFDNCNPRYMDYYSFRLHLCAQLAQILSIYVEQRLGIGKEKNIEAEWKPVISYMKENFSRGITIDELAKIVHMPASTFNRKFFNAFNISPIRYFDNLRVQKVDDLIRNTDWPISKIAHAIGIDNKYYFSKFFSKHLNLSPEEYLEVFRSTQ